MKIFQTFAFLVISTFCFAQNPATTGYLLTKANGSISIGTEVNTAPLTVANFSTAFPLPQTGTIVHLVSEGATNGRITFDTYNGASVTGSIFQGRRGAGTAALPTAAIADYTLSGFSGDGYGSTGFHNISLGGLFLKSEGTMTDVSAPTYISFLTTPTASITSAERMRILSTGAIKLNAYGSGTFTGTPTYALQVDASGNIIEGSLGGGVAWGAITGTLSSQTDLQSALDLKANLASPTFTGTVVLPNSTVTNAMLAGSIAYSKLSLTGAILNADLAGSIAYSKLSLTGAILNADLAGSIDATKINTGVVSNTEFNYLDGVTSALQAQIDGKQASGSYQPLNSNLTTIAGLTATTDNFLVSVASAWASRTPAQVKTTLSLDNVTNESKATMFTNATFTGTFTAPNGTITNAMLAGSIAASKLIGTDIATTGKLTNYNGIATVGNGVPSLLATIDATTQAANIATATLYAVPATGMYRVSIYITVTQAATTSSTMPSTTITYTDGNSGSNAHSTTTTATSAGNSVTTTFAQTTYILYAKTGTNIQYATGSYASSGATPMQYALRIKVEAL